MLFSGSGPYNGTVHYTSVTGDSASFTFNGTKITLSYSAYVDRGKMDIYLDGVKVYTLNEYANVASHQWQQSWTVGALTYGTHTLKLVSAGGGIVDIDALQVYDPPTPQPVGKYDDGYSAWDYLGSWVLYSGTGPYNGTLHYTSVAGDYASFPFSGTKITLSYSAYVDRGKMDIYIDGVKVATLNEYANVSSWLWQQGWTSGALSDGTHMLKLVSAGSGIVDIDAIQVYGSSDASTSTPTNTPTSTSTATYTYTPSNTPTYTYTLTNTPTSTNTATYTYTPSNTPTTTNTATYTYTPSNTPTYTYTPVQYPGAD